jgi:hypothetical protein
MILQVPQPSHVQTAPPGNARLHLMPKPIECPLESFCLISWWWWRWGGGIELVIACPSSRFVSRGEQMIDCLPAWLNVPSKISEL